MIAIEVEGLAIWQPQRMRAAVAVKPRGHARFNPGNLRAVRSVF
jgi:hypothetical protein